MLTSPLLWGILCGGGLYLLLWYSRTQRVSQQRRTMRAIYSLSEEITAASTPSEIAQKLVAMLPQVIPAAAPQLYLVNRQAKTLERVPVDAQAETISTPLSGSLDGMMNAALLCFRNRTPLTIPDTRQSPLIKASASEELPRSVLFVPLVAHEEALGVMEVDYAERVGSFAPEDQAAVQHLANQVAASLKLQEQRAMQQQLFRSEKLAATGQMISGIAGDLKGPLETITRLSLSLTDLLSNDPGLASETRRLTSEAARASDVVARMLSFARQENAAPRHVDLGPLVQRLVQFREGQWRERGLTALNKFEPEALMVLGVEGQLEQIFLTLFLDVERRAEQTMDRRVTVKTSVLSGRALVEIGHAVTAGVEPESDDITPARDGGALSFDVCKTIAENHGGEIRIHRRAGVFAFEVDLPSTGARSGAPKKVAAPVAKVRPLTIMLVDSEPNASRPLLNLLTVRGHRVVPIAAEEAAEVAPRLQFDAVFWTARAGPGNWNEFRDRVQASVGAFVLVSDGYNQELASSMEQNGGFLLSRPVQEEALDRILGEIGSAQLKAS
ncbi:MAG: GAF domain-containing protein [Acidobacteriota bacterium]